MQGKNASRPSLLFVLAFAAALAVGLAFCIAKSGYFVDEIYSYGLSNSYYSPFLKSAYDDDITGKVIDLLTGYGVASSPHDVRYSASTIKGPYVAAINHFDPSGMDGGVMGMMHDTIMYSSNEDYAALRYRFGAGAMQAHLDYCNVHSIDPGSWYVDYSATDLAKLWVGNYWYFYQDTNGNSEWCRNLYTEGLTEGNSIIHDALSGWYTVHAKPGWFPGQGFDVQNDAGIVMAGDHPYVVSIMSSACNRFAELRELVCAIDDVHKDMVR